MSVAGIASSGLSQLASVQRNYQQVRSEFKQLGQDLQGGNLTKAQADFVTLSQSFSTQSANNSTVTKALNNLGQAIQSGDVTAAQQALAAMPVGIVHPNAVSHHSHVPPMQGAFSQAINQIGQALQAGDLTAAQKAFSALQQTWQQMSPNSGSASTGATSTVPSASGLSLIA